LTTVLAATIQTTVHNAYSR